MATQKVCMELAGRTLELETGRLALQADGAVTIRAGDSMALVTVTSSDKVSEGIDFFPLTCDYEERLYAAGKIPGSFPKREGRPSEQSVLTCRLMDRGIRPLFPKGYRNEVQIIAMALSSDRQNQMDILAMIGASASLALSGLPVQHTLGSMRVARVDGEYVLYPTHEQCLDAELDLVVSATRDAIMMIEAGALEAPEDEVAEAVSFAHKECVRVIDLIEELKQKVAPEPRQYELQKPGEDLIEAARPYCDTLMATISIGDKARQRKAFAQARGKALEELAARFEDRQGEVSDALDEALKAAIRGQILVTGNRLDNRSPGDVRPLSASVGLAPRCHGTGLFQRGDTQVLCTVTLGMLGEAQRLDGLSDEESKTFIHQYNMPPFASGEVRMMRGPSRRAIGHGTLVERALLGIVPDTEEFPYTIRLVSEALGSDGSTSMGSVCAASLAMFDAGVPIDAHVAGMAMGIIYTPEKQVVLTDIQAMEDFNGDMDFKVAGTRRGVTAVQLDVKCTGLTLDLLAQAFEAARAGRMKVLDVMEACIAQPRAELSAYAPRMLVTEVPVEKIGMVIGPGGRTIRRIEALGVSVDVGEDGRVFVSATDPEAGEKAIAFIRHLTHDPEVGAVFDARVTRLMNMGAFCELVPGKEGLLRVGDYEWEHTPNLADVLSVGDIVQVKVTEVDDQGRINVSRKALLTKPNSVADSWDSRERRRPRHHGMTRNGAGPGGRARFREKRP